MSTKKIDRAFEAIKTVIDEVCAPRNLTPGEYKEVLDQLEEEIRERQQMAREDLEHATREAEEN